MRHNNTYTLYDSDGTVIGRKMTAGDVEAVAGVKAKNVAYYANNKLTIYGKWSVEVDSPRDVTVKDIPEKFAERWEKAVEPFRERVVWVKEYEPGVKKLRLE